MNNKTSDKNVANIEDDIKLVKRYLENSAYKETDSDFFKNGGWEMVDLEIPKAMANILAEREQMKKRYEEIDNELWERVKQCNNLQTEIDRIYVDKEELIELNRKQVRQIQELEEELENSIPKQAVIEALEDIEDYLDRLNGPDEDIEYIRQVKKELLEREK